MAASEAEILWWGPNVVSEPEQKRGPGTANNRTETNAEWGKNYNNLCFFLISQNVAICPKTFSILVDSHC